MMAETGPRGSLVKSASPPLLLKGEMIRVKKICLAQGVLLLLLPGLALPQWGGQRGKVCCQEKNRKKKNSGKTGFGKYAAVLLEYDVAGQEKGVKGKWSVGNRSKIVLRVK